MAMFFIVKSQLSLLWFDILSFKPFKWKFESPTIYLSKQSKELIGLKFLDNKGGLHVGDKRYLTWAVLIGVKMQPILPEAIMVWYFIKLNYWKKNNELNFLM